MFCLKLNLCQFEAFVRVELAGFRHSLDCGDGAKRCEQEQQQGVGEGWDVSSRFYTSLLSRVVNPGGGESEFHPLSGPLFQFLLTFFSLSDFTKHSTI